MKKFFARTLVSSLMTILIAFAPAAHSAIDFSTKYDVKKLKVTLPEGEFEASAYKPTKEKIKGILIISPTITGVSTVELSNARYFAKRGYAVLLTHAFGVEIYKPEPDMAQLDLDFFKPALSVEAFLPLMEKEFNLKKDLPVVAMGGSQGGIVTMVLQSLVPRIRAAWISVAGGDFPSIYANSMVPALIKFRTKHMIQLGINNQKDYEAYLRGQLTNDPLTVCNQIKTPFVQIIAMRDTYVPTSNQELLVTKCPKHAVKRYQIVHGSGVLMTMTMRKDILKYFDKEIAKKL